MWRRNILHKKREEVKSNLTERLFMLDGVFGPVLLHHRLICKDLEQYRLVNLSAGTGGPKHGSGGEESVTLAEFAAMQARQREYLSTKIEEASMSSRHRFRMGINAVLDDLRQRINEFQQEENMQQEDDQQTHGGKSGALSKLDGSIKERRGAGS